jgi:hypothetical protein
VPYVVLAAMPPKQGALKLAAVKPTQEELDAARLVLASADKKLIKSKFAGMAHWLKDNPDDSVSGSRGSERKAYLEQFLVFQMRQKAVQKVSTTTTTVETTTAKHTEVRWWSRQKMNTEFGETKAEGMRVSGKLETRPCRITGRNDEDFIEYACPDDWSQVIEGDKDTHQVAASGEADDGDLELLKGMKLRGSGDKDTAVAVKVEKLTPEEIAKDEAKKLMANPRPMLRRFQDYELECKMLVAKAESNRYTAELATDANKFIAKVSKVIKLLNGLCTSKAANEVEVIKLVEMTAKLIKEQDDLMQWAQNFGLVEKASKRKKHA